MSKPTFVCVHGAWHTSGCWDKVKSLLITHGYDCVCPALPATGSHPAKYDFTEDVQMIRSTVENLVNAGKDVVVVLHSLAGMAGGQALEGLDKESCLKRGLEGGVVRLVYIMAFLVPEDFQHSPRGTRDGMVESMKTDLETEQVTVDPKDAKAMFYQDLDDDAAAELAKSLLPQSWGSWWSKTTFAAWRYIPTTYVLCTQDVPTTIGAAEYLISTAQGSGKHMIDTVVRHAAGHSPFASQPEWTVNTLREAAGEKLEGN